MKFFLKCHEAHRLALEQMDRELSLVEAVRLHLHLSVCDACTRVGAQARLIREAMRRLGGASDPRDDA
jgi:hypothetical protein